MKNSEKYKTPKERSEASGSVEWYVAMVFKLLIDVGAVAVLIYVAVTY